MPEARVAAPPAEGEWPEGRSSFFTNNSCSKSVLKVASNTLELACCLQRSKSRRKKVAKSSERYKLGILKLKIGSPKQSYSAPPRSQQCHTANQVANLTHPESSGLPVTNETLFREQEIAGIHQGQMQMSLRLTPSYTLIVLHFGITLVGPRCRPLYFIMMMVADNNILFQLPPPTG